MIEEIINEEKKKPKKEITKNIAPITYELKSKKYSTDELGSGAFDKKYMDKKKKNEKQV